ncbi:UDP-glucose--hexose-1-phosphate uridylyltransferase [Streptococcus merionis]|uniref:UDP-glucose--hexose-1-phosphate uridylyltransferase n=1 Tax=Streptococcus merionis TaxID=400065 RepID=UPI003513F272
MNKCITTFVDKLIGDGYYDELDRIYLINRLLHLVGEGLSEEVEIGNTLIELKENLVEVAVKNGKIGASEEEKECLGAEIMNFITPLPSQFNQVFWTFYKERPEKALTYFHELSKDNDYIKVKAVAKNIYYQTQTEYGNLEITINLSKPEKDPKSILAARQQKSSNYPKCLLCMENEGYQGRINHPARANHRIIRLDLGKEKWGLQYSPYAYFNEHCIFLSQEHVPMAVTTKTFEQLLEIVDIFPDYFVGSNAGLPIVGGSILSHNHYQGGRHQFPMEVADVDRTFTLVGYDDIWAGILNWPMSVIRLRGEHKDRLIQAASHVLRCWENYSDRSADILAATGDVPHHTVTPIARRREGQFELDLVLRDNQTSEEFPDGIYHPHPDVQHIKKENIGLIEVMGLAVLPPRLKRELEEVEQFLLGNKAQIKEYHKPWAMRLLEENPKCDKMSVREIVRTSVGQIFKRVLEDAGVYKHTVEGQAAFQRFIVSLGIK